MNVRKSLAGLLIRVAHRIYRPKVTEVCTACRFDASVVNGVTTYRIVAGGNGGAFPGSGGGAGGYSNRPDDGPAPVRC